MLELLPGILLLPLALQHALVLNPFFSVLKPFVFLLVAFADLHLNLLLDGLGPQEGVPVFLAQVLLPLPE